MILVHVYYSYRDLIHSLLCLLGYETTNYCSLWKTHTTRFFWLMCSPYSISPLRNITKVFIVYLKKLLSYVILLKVMICLFSWIMYITLCSSSEINEVETRIFLRSILENLSTYDKSNKEARIRALQKLLNIVPRPPDKAPPVIKKRALPRWRQKILGKTFFEFIHIINRVCIFDIYYFVISIIFLQVDNVQTSGTSTNVVKNQYIN